LLTAGESLLIQRRRERLTQAGKGAQFGLSRYEYGKRERDLIDMPVTLLSFEDLTDAEKCVILRKRKSATQLEIALDMGISRYWLNQKELGHCDCSDLLHHLEGMK
jgi:hypothetical protein